MTMQEDTCDGKGRSEMLDPQDLRAIQEMIDSSIFGSENRMMTFYENVIQPQLQLLA